MIVAIINSAYHQVPIGDDSLPVFKNDKLMIYSKNQPVEVYADSILLGDDTASERYVLGDTFKASMATILQALNDHIHPTVVGPSGVSPQGPIWLAEKTTFDKNLSGIIKGKK